MEHETMSKLFLELSQVLPEGTKTARELRLEAENARLREAVQDAFYEGWFARDDRRDALSVHARGDWEVCKARAALKETDQ